MEEKTKKTWMTSTKFWMMIFDCSMGNKDVMTNNFYVRSDQ